MILIPFTFVRRTVFYTLYHLSSNPFVVFSLHKQKPLRLFSFPGVQNNVMMLTCYSVPRGVCSVLSLEPRILVGYAGTKEAKVILDHSPICFRDLQVLFIIVSYLVLVKNSLK